MEAEPKFQQYAIIELFGHSRIAGRVTEQTIGGCAFVRVDVPAMNGRQALTKLYGQGAIYAMTFVDEAAALMAAKAIQIQPISTWELEKGLKQLPSGLPPNDYVSKCQACGQLREDCECEHDNAD